MRNPTRHISDHLLVYLTLSFALGIVAAFRYDLAKVTLPPLLFSLCLMFTVVVALHFFRRQRTVLGLILPFLILLGFYHSLTALQLPSEAEHIFNRITEKIEAVVVGTIETSAEFDGKNSRIILSSEYFRFQDSPALLPATGKILLYFPGPWPANLLPGDKLAVRADFKRPEAYRTPGVFDYAQYLAQNNIWISGFIRSPLFIQRLAEHQDLFHSLRYLPERVRTTIGAHIEKSVPNESQGLYRAILLGDCSRIDDAVLETFKASGTFHILAISGLHMTVIFTLLYTALYWLLGRSEKLLFRYPLRKWAIGLCLPVLLGYSLLAGLNTPVFRAVIMSSMVIIAICSNRPKSPSSLLAFAALVILSLDPLAILTASFQLSFVATMAILFLFPVLKNLILPKSTESISSPNRKQIVVNWLLAAILVSTVATIATAPITLSAFNRFSPLGILANLVVEPLICLWSLPAGFLAIPFIYLQPEIASWFLQLGTLGLIGALKATSFFSGIPCSTWWQASPPVWLIICFYGGFFGSCLLWQQPAQKWLGLSVSITIASLLLMLFPGVIPQKKPADSLRFTFLDVGQGSATLIEFPSGTLVLVDGGGSSRISSDVGERVIAPYLWNRGINKLDAVAITHPDADHYNGLGFILKHFSPKQLWTKDRHGHDASFRQLMLLAKNKGIRIVTPTAGMKLESKDKEDVLQCITNIASADPETRESRDQANSGTILKACSKGYCALFPGDIGRGEELTLVGRGLDLNSNILLSPHHGSITSNSPEFLAAVSPDFLVVSAGRSGQEYFPHARLADDCQSLGISLLSTRKQGTLEVHLNERQLRIYGFAKKWNNPLYAYEAILVGEKSYENPRIIPR